MNRQPIYTAFAISVCCLLLRRLTVLLSLLMLAGCSQHMYLREQMEIDRQIHFYTSKISDDEENFAVYSQLATAYIEKGKLDQDPYWLRKAEQALQKSLAIQPNFHAYKVMAVLNHYRHQFQSAIRWGERAHAAWPQDSSIVALLVEANLALGKHKQAKALLASDPQLMQQDFYLTTAKAQYLNARDKPQAAAQIYQAAAQLAASQGHRQLELWAYVQAAGALLDAGAAQEALPYLQAAQQIDAHNTQLRIHWAEFYAATGNKKQALTMYQSILKHYQSAEIHHQAFRIAQDLNLTDQAQQHFSSAQQIFLRILNAGEIYSLGPLAQLYCDAQLYLDEALNMAERNLQYQNDRHAHDVLACVQTLYG